MEPIPHTKLLVLEILRNRGLVSYELLRHEYQHRLGIGGGSVADMGFASMINELIAAQLIGRTLEASTLGEKIKDIWLT